MTEPTPAAVALARARTRVQAVLDEVAAMAMQPDTPTMVNVTLLIVDHARLEIAAQAAGITAADPAEAIPLPGSEQPG